MRKETPYILSLVFVLALQSCANELPLTGGEKDVDPPVAEKFDPPNQSTRFATKKITIEFNEFVKLKDPAKQILVSPPGTQFQAAEKGKSIELTITSTLKQNSTYVINFGDAIVDNNEGNVLHNLIYTFSTGDILDSLSTSFKVLDAFTLKPVANVKVMLYDQDTDSLPLTELPYYAGTSNAEGKITIGYMKPGSFKVFALLEENKNYIYDKPNEGIGFLDQPVNAGDSVPLRILFFREEVANPKIAVARMPVAGMVHFKFNGNIEKNQFTLLSKNYPFDTNQFEFMGNRRDTAVYWFKPRVGDDTLRFMFTRKLGEKDTVKVYPKIINQGKNNQVTGAEAVKIKTVIPADFDFYKRLEIEFSVPLDSLNRDTILITEEGKSIPALLKPMDGARRKYYLDYSFKQSKNYVLYFPKRSVKGILGTYMDSTLFNFKTSNEKAYKVISLNIKHPSLTGGAILELLDAQDNVLQEKKINWADTNLVEFNRLRQGIYRIRLIYDINSNGKWDPGSYAEKRPPEKVVYFPENIDIKPNFDYALEWEIMK